MGKFRCWRRREIKSVKKRLKFLIYWRRTLKSTSIRCTILTRNLALNVNCKWKLSQPFKTSSRNHLRKSLTSNPSSATSKHLLSRANKPTENSRRRSMTLTRYWRRNKTKSLALSRMLRGCSKRLRNIRSNMPCLGVRFSSWWKIISSKTMNF